MRGIAVDSCSVYEVINEDCIVECKGIRADKDLIGAIQETGNGLGQNKEIGLRVRRDYVGGIGEAIDSGCEVIRRGVDPDTSI